MSIGHFLAGIGALIWDAETKRYLFLRRSEQKDFGQGAWECVTGRVDQGENFEQALHREVLEELNAQVQIDFLIATTHFYRGEKIPKNELLGLIYGCTIIDPGKIQKSDEHSEMLWASADEAYNFLPTRHWLHRVIQRAEMLRNLLPPEIKTEFLNNGFEL